MPGISATDQVIGNSDLVRQILLHLDHGSLQSCLTVSESLFKISGPLLYRHIAVTHPSAFQRLITQINPPYPTRRSSRFPHTKRLLGCTKSISLSAWLWSQPRFPYSPEYIATTLFPDGLDTIRLEHYETMCERPHRPHTSKCIIRLAFLLQPKHLVLNLTGVKQVFKCLAENEVVAMANRLDHLTIRLSPHSSETYSAAAEILRVATLAQKTSIILAEGFPNSESRMKLYQAHSKGDSPLPTIGRLVELIKHLSQSFQGESEFYILDELLPVESTFWPAKIRNQPEIPRSSVLGAINKQMNEGSTDTRIKLLSRQDWMQNCHPDTMPEGYEENWNAIVAHQAPLG